MKNKGVTEAIYIFIGATLLAFGISVFYNPNQLVVGGFSGIGIIIENFTRVKLGYGIPVSVTNLVLNAPLIIIAYKVLGKKFIIKTAIATAYLSLALSLCSLIPPYKGDILLVAIYGGIIQGAGSGFVLRGMASTGGSELLAALIHKIIKYLPISKIMLVFDIFVIGFGVFLFGLDKALYAIISIYIGSKCISLILEGMSFAKAAFIISHKSDKIAEKIMERANRGVTSLSGRGMYTKKNTDVLLCVFAQKEIAIIKDIVSEIDKDAFILVTDVKEVLGEGFSELINE